MSDSKDIEHTDAPLPVGSPDRLKAMSAARMAMEGKAWDAAKRKFVLVADPTARQTLIDAGTAMHGAYSGTTPRTPDWIAARDGQAQGSNTSNTLAFIDSTAAQAQAGSLDDPAIAQLLAMAAHPGNAPDFSAAARGGGGNHELFNAANIPTVMMQIATGTHPSMPTHGRRADGTDAPPSELMSLAIPTNDYAMRPVPAGTSGVGHLQGDPGKYVAHGHTNAAFVHDPTDNSLHPSVTTEGASRGTMHAEQDAATRRHKSFRGLMMHQIKITDRHMANGGDYLDAHDNGGFHSQVRVRQRGKDEPTALDTPRAVFDKARAQETARKKQRTRALKQARQFDELTSESEVDSESDVDSANEDDYYENQTRKKKRFVEFATKHGLGPSPGNGPPPPPPPPATGAAMVVQ